MKYYLTGFWVVFILLSLSFALKTDDPDPQTVKPVVKTTIISPIVNNGLLQGAWCCKNNYSRASALSVKK